MGGEAEDASGVFINCPFDPSFEPLFDAIFFTIVALGLVPRSAIEAPADARLDRIKRVLRGSRYSVHDLSRAVGEGDQNLARFNMPLELGMAMQLRWEQQDLGRAEPHDWFIMTGKHVDYDRFASDLKGLDIPSHGESVERIVELLVGWLQVKPAAASHVTIPAIIAALPDYREAKRIARENYGGTWNRYIDAAVDVAERNLPTL